MIAGRRKADETGSSSSSSSSTSSRSRKADSEEERPARTSRAASAEAKQDEAADDDKPRVRRGRRGGRGRRPAEASEQPDRDEADEPSDDAEEAPVAEPVEEEPAAPSRRATPRKAASSTEAPAALLDEITALRTTVAKQERMLGELRTGIEGLGQRITMSGYRPRIAVFVDVPNLIYGYEGDGSLNMGKILDMLIEGRDLVRATAYSPVSDDPREPMEQQRFVAPFVPYEYRIVTKPLKRFADGSIKGNFDVEMAIDMVLMADRVDVMAIVSGDADFARAVEAVQQKGVRVEVVAFAGSTSLEMRALADHYLELGRVVDKIL